MLTDEQKKDIKKYNITARKSGGDDAGSWAVFISNRVFINGLTHLEVEYYKRKAIEHCKARFG